MRKKYIKIIIGGIMLLFLTAAAIHFCQIISWHPPDQDTRFLREGICGNDRECCIFAVGQTVPGFDAYEPGVYEFSVKYTESLTDDRDVPTAPALFDIYVLEYPVRDPDEIWQDFVSAMYTAGGSGGENIEIFLKEGVYVCVIPYPYLIPKAVGELYFYKK